MHSGGVTEDALPPLREDPTARLELTRAAGLRRLADMLPHFGLDYARRRNYVPGPGQPAITSGLSPWLRLRLLTEHEVIAAAQAAHGGTAERFVQEVFWRTYYKGNLEQHPDAWHRLQAGAADAAERLARTPGLARLHAQATQGVTGLACFDCWARTLIETGWLHNHVRLWFASIWIFTLGLPWELGARFFAHHLLDHDPASNTLSWRWVGGLHTRGKCYVARAENIARYTDGRFNPVGELDEMPAALTEAAPPAAIPLPAGDTWPLTAAALLLHEDDLAPESLVPDHVRIVRIGVLAPQDGGAAAVRTARLAALADAAARSEAAFDAPAAHLPAAAAIGDWAAGAPVVTPYAPVGPVADVLAGQDVHRIQRGWDQMHWPHCARGFFQLRAKVA